MENIFVEFLPPWVESGTQPAFYDKESGSVLQQTARMYARVNMLIRMFNKLSKETKETVEDYINQFNELHEYVEDYFENLDVQEEINNKLDAMAEAGTLTDIIAQYLTLAGVLAFSTVADLANAENLAVGSKVKTYGYKRQGDGIYDLYVVREILNTDVVDGYNIVALTNTDDLIAERMQSGKKVVAKIKSTDNLQEYLNLKIDKTIVLEQDYTATAKVFINDDTTIDLNNHTLTCNYDPTETIIFCYGLTDTFTGYNGYKNITIRNGSFSGACICMMHNKNVTIENVEFLTPNSRHALQIAGSYDVTIKNCVFNGTRSDYADSDEAINIDPCNYDAQPFMEQTSVMYDHTANKNIIIEGNVFNTTEEAGFRHTCCMGSHGADDNNQTIAIGVTIRNNDFGAPYTTCVDTRDWKDVTIENNVGKFATSGVNTQTYGIRVRGSLENASVVDNTITNPTTFFYTSGQAGDTKKNINIQGNTVKTLDDTNYQCIHIMATTDCNIRDNIFYYKENCIYTNAVSGVYCERVNIINNFISKTSNTSNQGIRIKGSSYVTINDNDFAYVGLSSEAGYAIDVSTNANATQIEICNNKTKFPRKFLTNDTYQACVYCRNNNALYSNASSYGAGTTTGSGTFTKPLTYFSKIYLQFGDSSDQLVVELQPWFNATKFDTSNRTWKGTVVASDGTVGTYAFNVTDSATKYSFTTDLGLRYIYVSD